MKTIKLGNREINIEGSALTPFFYKKAFKQSMSGDIAAMSGMEEDFSLLDDVNILQMVWAMEKTTIVDTNNTIKGFESWLKDLGKIDIAEVAFDVIEVAMDATFHSSKEESDGE